LEWPEGFCLSLIGFLSTGTWVDGIHVTSSRESEDQMLFCMYKLERVEKMRRKKLAVIAGVFIAAVLCFGNTATAQVSPAGGDGIKTWDLVITGVKKGSAYLTFYADGTIAGYALVTPTPLSKKGVEASLGCTDVQGEWGFDSRGKIVGYLNNHPASEARLDIRSFTANVSENKMTLKGSAAEGGLKFSGVPAGEVPDLTGLWTLTVKKLEGEKKTANIEMVTAYPFDGNLFYLEGAGANMCVSGWGMVSYNKTFSISINEAKAPESGICADVEVGSGTGIAAVGTVDLGKGRATRLKGTQETGESTAKGIKILMDVFMNNTNL
jgi:hypothetical protein